MVRALQAHSIAAIVAAPADRTTWRVLNHFTGESARAEEIRPYQDSIYVRHAAEWGDRYFGANMYRDARRCYLKALRLAPGSHLRPQLLWRLTGTFLGARGYAWVKQQIKRGARA